MPTCDLCLTNATVLTMDRDEFRSVVAQSLGAAEDFDRILRERLGGGESQ